MGANNLHDEIGTHGHSSGLQINVLLISPTKAARDEVCAIIGGVQGVHVMSMTTEESRSDKVARAVVAPNLVLADVGAGTPEEIQLIHSLRNDDLTSQLATIALLDSGTELGPVRAIRAGADDVLLRPLNLNEALEVFRRAVHLPRSKAHLPSALGKVISFTRAVGGVGATTLAVNSALTFAETMKDDDICLFDFDIQFGNAASLLDMANASRIDDLLADPERLDREMLENLMVRHKSGLRVLTAPRKPISLDSLTPNTVSAMIQLARRRFAFTVIDLPAAVTSWTDAVLEESDAVYFVSPLSVSAAFRARKFFDSLQAENMSNLPMKVVANRYHGAGRSNDVAVSQFSKAIRRQVDYLIPNDYSLISRSHSQGEAAIQLKPNSIFAKKLSGMLAADFADPRKRKKQRSWFSFGKE